jgi:hypothetical protein
MLVIGGVELNPGPPTNKQQFDEIVQRLNDLSRDVRDSRMVLEKKFDDVVHDLNTKINLFETKMATHSTRLDAIEHAHATMATQLATLQAKAIVPVTDSAATARIDVVERAHADIAARLTALQALPLSPATSAVPATAASVNVVVR